MNAARGSPVLSNGIAQALAAAGIIDGDISSIRRIVLDLQAGEPAVLYVERFADERWLDVATTLDGIRVVTAAGDRAAHQPIPPPALPL